MICDNCGYSRISDSKINCSDSEEIVSVFRSFSNSEIERQRDRFLREKQKLDRMLQARDV
jgi:hypothetical protein